MAARLQLTASEQIRVEASGSCRLVVISGLAGDGLSKAGFLEVLCFRTEFREFLRVNRCRSRVHH